MSYTMSLGPKQPTHHPLRHETDATWEILVDFDDGREGSLGWVSVMHDGVTGKLHAWALLAESGDYLTKEGLYPTKNEAMAAASRFLDGFLETCDAVGWVPLEGPTLAAHHRG